MVASSIAPCYWCKEYADDGRLSRQSASLCSLCFLKTSLLDTRHPPRRVFFAFSLTSALKLSIYTAHTRRYHRVTLYDGVSSRPAVTNDHHCRRLLPATSNRAGQRSTARSSILAAP